MNQTVWRKTSPASLITTWQVLTVIHQTCGLPRKSKTPHELLRSSAHVILNNGHAVLEDKHIWRRLPQLVGISISEITSIRGILDDIKRRSGESAETPDDCRYVTRDELRTVLEMTLKKCR